MRVSGKIENLIFEGEQKLGNLWKAWLIHMLTEEIQHWPIMCKICCTNPI